jgi:Flp pilus assembly pilin Flp
MTDSNCGVSVVPAMVTQRRRARRKAGQALIEYAFLLIVLATIGISVIVLAGNQIKTTYNTVYDHIVHIGDQNWQDQHQVGQ